MRERTFFLSASPRYKDLITQIPGFNYNSRAEVWQAPAEWSIALAARGVLGDGLELSPEVTAWAQTQRDRMAWAEAARTGAYTLPQLESNLGLYDFQTRGVTFLVAQEAVLLADEMGTGKTVQAAVALKVLADLAEAGHRPSPFPALIVATRSMKHEWARALETWAGVEAIVTPSAKGKREKAIADVMSAERGVLVTNWDTLRLHSRLAPYGSISLTSEESTPGLYNAARFQTVIADEAHKGHDPKAKQTRALWAIGEAATYRWALTGTPVNDQAEDLWTVMHFVAPREWPSRTRWISRYALGGTAFHGGFETYGYNPHTEAELQAFLRPRFLRRTKAEVLPDLPKKTYSYRWAEMAPKQAKAYKDMAKEQIALLDSGVLVAFNDLVKHGRLSQLAAATPVLNTRHVEDGSGDGSIEETYVAELVEPSCKIDTLLEVIEEGGDTPIVVGAESRKLIELAARVLDRKKISYVLITGMVSDAERQVAVDTFQTGGAQVCLVTLGAGSEGITLTRANRLVFLEVGGGGIRNNQFEDRIVRIGQEADSVEIITIITAGTVDVARVEDSYEKESVGQGVLHDPQWVKKALLP